MARNIFNGAKYFNLYSYSQSEVTHILTTCSLITVLPYCFPVFQCAIELFFEDAEDRREINLPSTMDLGKKLTDNFTSAVSRVKQYTQEVLGATEKTAVDKSFEDLVEKCEKTRVWTEKILTRVESVLHPSPSARPEDSLLEKIDNKREHYTPFAILSREFIEAGNDLGVKLPYGEALLKTGQAFRSVAKAEKEYIRTILVQYVYPLRKFLENDFKAIDKERKQLEMKRLDLDACKAKLKRMKTAESQAQAEQELRVAQAEYDRQLENTRLLLDGVNAAHANHLRCLQYFVEFHSQYYDQCHQYMAELQRELNKITAPEEGAGIKDWKGFKEKAEESISGISAKMSEVVSGLPTVATDSQQTISKDGKKTGTSSI